MEQKNLIREPRVAKQAKEMENRLYAMLGDAGGMDIPMNQPRGNSQNKRWEERGGDQAADFPRAIVVEQPLNRQAK